jgi:hypothetical protein
MIFGSFQTFKPCEGYDEKSIEERYFLDSNGLMFPSEVFASIIHMEYWHRELVQLGESLKQTHQALKKEACLGDGVEDLHDLEKAIKDFGIAPDLTARAVYRLATILPRRPLLKIYDEIRQDPTWYLHRDLVQDCIGKCGCCSRGCRCCEYRHLDRAWKTGIGHCTARCYCCEIHRGFSYTDDEADKIRENLLEDLSSASPAYLLTMTEAYFSKPGMFGPKGSSFVGLAMWQLKRLKRVFGII